MTRARLLATTFGCAVLATLAAAACRFTGGLTGGEALDAGADAGPDLGCDADLARAIDNCGACGHACAPGANAFAACVDGGCVASCAAGFGDCDDAGVATGCETNLQNTKTSCGRCGHDCQGGNCQGGNCQPVTLTSVINAPVHIVLDETNVYGINAFGAVIRIPKAGGALTQLANGDTTPQSPAPHLALANGTLYYTSFGGDAGADAAAQGTVSAAPLDGGKPQVLTTANQPFAIDATQAHVYWSEGNPSGPPFTTSVKRCKLPCGGGGTTEVAPQSGRIFAIMADANNLLWANAGTPPNNPESAVTKCTPGSCAATLFPLTTSPPSPSNPFALAVDKTTVYFTTGGGFIGSCPLAGCSADAQRLDSFQFTPRFVATDGTTLYWTNADGTIKSLPRAGPAASERTVYQSRGSSPWDIAVDATAIYWTDLNGVQGGTPGASALFKLAR